MAIPAKDYPMYEAMKKYGGGFVSRLADLLSLADSNNYAKLEASFPEYFKEYRDIASKDNSDCHASPEDGCVHCEAKRT